jgi:signal transduction histidine kinase
MKVKILLIVLLLVVASVIVTLNLFFYQTHEAEMATQINQQQTIVARTIAHLIDSTMEHFKQEVVSLAGLLSERGMHREGIAGFTRFAFEEIGEDISVEMVLFGNAGRVIHASQSGYLPSGEDLELLERTLTVPPRQVVMKRSGEKLLKLKVITPVRKRGDLLGALMIVIDIDDFNEKFIVPIKAGERGHAWIMDETGTLVYHPTQPEMLGRNISSHGGECFGCHKSFNAEQQILESTGVGHSSYIAPHGEDKLIAFSRTTQIGWIVCISIPYSEVTASMKNSMDLQSMLVLTIIASTIIVSFVVIVINRQRLRAEARAIYADKLKDYASALEEIVNERTRELRSEKEKLDAVIGAISSGICVFDESGRRVWMNKVMEGWFSDPSGTSGQKCLERLNIEGTDMLELARKKGYVQETIYLDLGARKGTFQVSVSPFHGPEGASQFLVLLQDVTDLKMAEEQMIQSDKLGALSRLSAGVAHEIGNPLTSISSYVQILREMKFDEFSSNAIETISKHVRRIESILQKMSSFAKSQDEEIRPHGIAELVTSTVDLVRYDRRTMNIEVNVEIPEDMPPVRVNGSQMVQIIINIILNAADAMGEGGMLTISASRMDGDVLLRFNDTGHGINPEDMKKIFEPFFTTKPTGTGLGLAVSQSIARSFGGSIEAESEPGKGAMFTVRVPVHEE